MGVKKLPADFVYLEDMYSDEYFPKFLVDKIKEILQSVVSFLEQGNTDTDLIQAQFDNAVLKINDLQDEFYEHDSELETGARESIGATVDNIIHYFEINIDPEEALREREW
ncbi:MAG: hypothetical protein J0I41_21565 [Filimonas sp.]|nr:hypothetical protein [Filimonas sp.]